MILNQIRPFSPRLHPNSSEMYCSLLLFNSKQRGKRGCQFFFFFSLLVQFTVVSFVYFSRLSSSSSPDAVTPISAVLLFPPRFHKAMIAFPQSTLNWVFAIAEWLCLQTNYFNGERKNTFLICISVRVINSLSHNYTVGLVMECILMNQAFAWQWAVMVTMEVWPSNRERGHKQLKTQSWGPF